ncbi:MAG: hypothetical protein C4516_08485 [Oxalobacter sp.]|nr:MAG: hypothetical protein C4516_08485 [Oxalobacter sp.]
MKIRQIIAGLALMGLALSATAIERWFPLGTKRGVASFASYPKLYIDKVERKTSPGLRVWNTNNTIQFLSEAKGEKVIINYAEDTDNSINRIWILTPREAEKPLRPGMP